MLIIERTRGTVVSEWIYCGGGLPHSRLATFTTTSLISPNVKCQFLTAAILLYMFGSVTFSNDFTGLLKA